MTTQPPIITLLTDFGTDDVFVGVMKGVMLGICPAARLVDLTHAVPPQDVVAGSFHLNLAWRWFPAGTVHLAIVDPGVGTARRAIAATIHGHRFVVPDNGLLGPLLAEATTIVELTEPAYRLPTVSTTFHGRDRFAPAAAHLAAGVPLLALGPAVNDPVPGLWAAPETTADTIRGQVAWIDRFGNAVTTIDAALLATVGDGRQPHVEAGSARLSGLRTTYGEAASGELLALVNSWGYLEIAVNQGSAAAQVGLRVGSPVTVRFTGNAS